MDHDELFPQKAVHRERPSNRRRGRWTRLGAIAAAALLLGSFSTTTAGAISPVPANLPLLSPAQPGTLIDCAALSEFSFASTAITRTEIVPAGTVGGAAVGEHCVVEGRMNERVSDVDGQSYAIGFEMRLPTEWNGRFLYQANGGLDGSVTPAVGAVGGGESGLQMGFAVISSDAGHSGSLGATFGLDPQARLDYGYQAVGTLTPMAKSLIAEGYGRGPDRSYMTGGSNGGRHTMVGAVRYADQYDGFLALAPGFNLPQTAVAQVWAAQQWASIATDPADLSTAFTQSERQTVAGAILARCDGLDNLVDGMVNAEKRCQSAFSLERDVPTCVAERDGTCLSIDQKRVVSAFFGGARTSDGQSIYSSFPLEPGITQSGWGFWSFIASVFLSSGSTGFVFTSPPDAPTDAAKYAFTADIDRLARSIYATEGIYAESAMEFMTPPDPTDLDAMRERGGKMIVLHGGADGAFSTDDTARWFEELETRYDGNADDFARYYYIPGAGHVEGGLATDRYAALAALVDWVENGKQPQELVATVNPANPEVPAEWSDTRSRPLCPYPSIAVYVAGDPETAQSFTCSVSAAPIAISAPSITGQADVGKKLAASTGDWSGTGIAYSYQWQRDGIAIRGATKAVYRVASADQGTSIDVVVTARNSDGAASAVSDPVIARYSTVALVVAKPLVAFSSRPVVVTVRVLPAKASADGQVSITVAGQSFVGEAVDGVASIAVGTLPRGAHIIKASYAGDAVSAPSQGVGLVLVLR